MTPSLDACGIAGVARRWLIAEVNAQQTALTAAAVESADAVVLTNALHGPRQAVQLAQQRWRSLHERRKALMAAATPHNES